MIAEKNANLSESVEDKKDLEEFKQESNQLEELLQKNINQKKINLVRKKFHSSTLDNNLNKYSEKSEIKNWKSPLGSIYETRNSIDTNLDMNDELAMELIKIKTLSSSNNQL